MTAVLCWSNPAAADATGGERRWADDRGNLTRDFRIVPDHPRLALVLPDRTILEGEQL